MEHSVATIVFVSLFWLCLIFVTQIWDSKLVCVKRTEGSTTWCSLLPLKTAEGTAVPKENYFECQIYRKAIKSRLGASWKSNYCHMQWWHKGSEIPIWKQRAFYAANRIRLANSVQSHLFMLWGFFCLFVYLFVTFLVVFIKYLPWKSAALFRKWPSSPHALSLWPERALGNKNMGSWNTRCLICHWAVTSQQFAQRLISWD